MAIPMEHYEEAAAYIRLRMTERPEVCLVLGSGLGRLAEEVEDAVSIPYEDIPHFPRSTVASHAGRLVLGRLNGRPAAVMAGRFHYYEGYSMETITFYVRVMHLLQVKKLLITNAAGGVNESFRVGDFMLITDHLKFFTDSPPGARRSPLLASGSSISAGPIRPGCSSWPRTRRKNLAYLCAAAYIFIWLVHNLKHRPKSAPSACWAGMRWACRRCPRSWPRRSAAWRCWEFPASPT